MGLLIEPVGGEVHKGSWVERKHTIFSFFFLTDVFTTSTPTGLMHRASITPLALDAVLKCRRLYSEDDWPTAKIVIDAQVCVWLPQTTGETFDPTRVNRWHRYQLLLSWQMHPVSAETSNFRWRFKRCYQWFDGLWTVERSPGSFKTLNPACYLDMGKSFAFPHLCWALCPFLSQ